MSKLITLKPWIERHFAGPGAPSTRLARAWVKSNRIRPKPVLIGRQYYFHEDAEVVDKSPGGSLVDALKASMERRAA